jgi:hypothetical protein
MDLDFIQGQFADFGTFGKNVGTAFQSIPELLLNIVDFFDSADKLSSNTEEVLEDK